MISLIIGSTVLWPLSSLAGAKVKNPFKTNTIQGFLGFLVNSVLLPIGAVICAVMVIYAGFQFVTAKGKPEGLKTARRSFLAACVGSAILLGAWIISQAISGTIDALKT